MVLAAASALRFSEGAVPSAEALGLIMLEADPHARRLDHSTQLAAVSEALADGTSTARNLRARFPCLALGQMTRELGLPINTTDADPMVGSIWRFAEYQPRPPRIVLYRSGLAPLERALSGPHATQLLGQAALADVFVAHELYHHLEAMRSDVRIARRYQPTLLRIGKWHWRTGVPALAEIAAGAFAQSLLELPCHPKMLDFVAVDVIAP